MQAVIPAQVQYWMDELNDPKVSINLKDNTAQKVEELIDVMSSQLVKYEKDKRKYERKGRWK